MREKLPVEKPVWDSMYIRPVWRNDLKRLFESTASFEELFAEVQHNGKPEDVAALLDMLQSSGALNEAMSRSSQLPATMESTFYQEWCAAKTNPSRQRDIVRERTKAFQTMDVIAERSATRFPLAHMFMREGSLIKRAMEMRNSVREGAVTLEKLEQEIRQNEPNAFHRSVLNNALHLGVFVDRRAQIPVREVPLEPPLVDNIELYSGVAFKGVHARKYKLLNQEATCRVECLPEPHPFVFGMGEIQLSNTHLCFWISRFHGDLLMDGTTVTRIDGMVPDRELSTLFKRVIWGTVIHGIEQGKLKELNPPTPLPLRAPIEVSPEQTAAVEPEASRETPILPEKIPDEVQPAQIQEEESFAGSASHTETPELEESSGIQRRAYIPPLTHRQLIRTLVRCGAQIVSGGKHLLAVYEGKPISVYNAHGKKARQFQSSEIHRTLAALNMSPELFLSKL